MLRKPQYIPGDSFCIVWWRGRGGRLKINLKNFPREAWYYRPVSITRKGWEIGERGQLGLHTECGATQVHRARFCCKTSKILGAREGFLDICMVPSRKRHRLGLHEECDWWDLVINSLVRMGNKGLCAKIPGWDQMTRASLSRWACDPASPRRNKPERNVAKKERGLWEQRVWGRHSVTQLPMQIQQEKLPFPSLPKITAWCYWWGMAVMFQLGTFQLGMWCLCV